MLEIILEHESKLVAEESIAVLNEFEAIDDEIWIDEGVKTIKKETLNC